MMDDSTLYIAAVAITASVLVGAAGFLWRSCRNPFAQLNGTLLGVSLLLTFNTCLLYMMPP